MHQEGDMSSFNIPCGSNGNRNTCQQEAYASFRNINQCDLSNTYEKMDVFSAQREKLVDILLLYPLKFIQGYLKTMDDIVNMNEDSTSLESLKDKILPRVHNAVIEHGFTSEIPSAVGSTTRVYDSHEPVCEPLKQSYLLVVSVAPALVVIENLIFFAAVFLYRRKLKHNNVYMYVTSALFANILTSLWAFYHFLNYYYGLESWEPTSWWAFRKGMTAGFSLVLCGNIGLLIYAIEDSTYVVGRLVSGNMTNSRSNNRLNPKFRMHKAMCLITIAWILPFLYGLMAMTDWSCTRQCTCTLYYASGDPICKGDKCSRLYTPMAKSYLLIVVIIWAIECLSLLVIIGRSALSFPRPIVRNVDDNSTEMGAINDATNNNNAARSIRRLIPKLSSSYKFPIILLGFFVACTAPVMVLFVLDFAMTDFRSNAFVINVVTPLPLVYCLISPILLTQRLSGMKSAMQMALSFSWLKRGCGNLNGSNKKTGSNRFKGSSLSVTRNSDGKIFNSRASAPVTPV